MKFGIVIPKDFKNAHDLDKLNKNKLWDAAITKALSRVQVAFHLLEDNVLQFGLDILEQ